jgi:hypothetical protein
MGKEMRVKVSKVVSHHEELEGNLDHHKRIVLREREL